MHPVEIIRFRVSAANAAAFLAARLEANRFLQANTSGFQGVQVIQESDDNWLVLIHWADEAAMRAAQAITETAPVISAFVATSDAFVSFTSGTVQQSSLV